MKNFKNLLNDRLEESISVKKDFLKNNRKELIKTARTIKEAFDKGKKLYIIGNGGSAADAQHMAAEFTGRFKVDREPLPAIALTTDTSALTAIGNDYSYDQVFSRQVRALVQKGDVLFAISTSGKSPNVIRAVMDVAHKATIIGLTGDEGGELKPLSNICLCASLGRNSAAIQETHIWAIHTIIEMIENL